MNKIMVIFGCGGHARSVADVLLNNNRDAQLIFVDQNADIDEKIFHFPVFSELPVCDVENTDFHYAIGDNQKRRRLYQNNAVSVISKDAYIGTCTDIQNGCFIAHKVHIGPEVQIGKSTIINSASVIEHEVKIGDFCHIAPNCTVCGRVNIGNNVFIGAGAVIKDYIRIVDNVIIGSGAVVVKDIVKAGVYFGCPAVEKK